MYKLISITGKTIVEMTKEEADRLAKVLRTREPRVWDLETGGFLVLRNVAAALPMTGLDEIDELEQPDKVEDIDKLSEEVAETVSQDDIGETSPAGGLVQPDTLPDKPETVEVAEVPETPAIDEGDLCPDCDGEMEIRRKTATNGVVQYRPQCIKCGKKGNLLKKDLIQNPESLNELE